jgi:BirA family biotin operon repressor/biotin-[acetyl-CoA-carboxylase] ligase
LKWPNDLLVDGRKLGGILVESTPTKSICGIGINLSWAPEGAATLDEPRDRVFERLRVAMDEWTHAGDERVLAEWRARSATLGRKVRVEAGNRVIEGMATDLGPHGELIVDGEAIVAGSVTHL